MAHRRRTRRHKNIKSRRTRRYRKQRGGDEQPIVQTQTNITETIDQTLNTANTSIGDAKNEVEKTVSGWLDSVSSLFSSDSQTQSSSNQIVGGKKRRRNKRTYKR
jgi:hypothetical protein